MSARQTYHLEVLPARQQSVMRACADPSRRWDAYLAGGTALALGLGHRQSDDLDWFTPRTLDPTKLLADVAALGFPVEVVQNDVGTFLAEVGGVKFSVFRYRYAMIDDLVVLGGVLEGCRLASLGDLAAMKLAAIIGRATKRDYVDVYQLLTLERMPLSTMLEAFKMKFPQVDAGPVLRALTYFADVEKQQMPVMLTPTRWMDVKRVLRRAAQSLVDAPAKPSKPARGKGGRRPKPRKKGAPR